MLKDFTLSLELDPKTNETVQTSAVFWSHDVNTAKIYIELLRKGAPIILNKGVTVRVMMLFDDENKSEHIYTAKIEDELKGLVSIMLEESMRMYVGQVTCGVYVDYQNEEKTDNGYFTFDMRRSLIDKDMPALKELYISEFEKGLSEFSETKKEINVLSDDVKKNLSELESQIQQKNLLTIVDKEDLFSIIEGHASNESNPHKVTAEQINAFTKEETVDFLRKENKKMDNNSTFFIAHRGNHVWFPENSLDAFSQVRSHQGIETDIQTTSDGEWIVMHDLTVDRTTNGTGKVKEKTLEEVRSLELKGADWYKNLENSKKVPTFTEFLSICKEKNKTPIVEIKGSGYTDEEMKRLKENIEEYYQGDEVVIISFDKKNLQAVREQLPESYVMLLHEHLTKDLIDEVHSTFKYKCAMNVNHGNINDETKDMITYAHGLGMKVGFWTVHYEAMKNLISLGADFITTDDESSRLKVGKVTLENSFRENQSTYLSNNKVIQKENGTAFLKLSLEGGSNASKTQIGILPNWAVPTKSTYVSAVCRTSSGVSVVTLDIIGKNNPTGSQVSKPGAILTGLGWEQRTTWVDVECTYDLY